MGSPTLPPAIIVDIDGTVAVMADRDPYDYDRVSEDTPNVPVITAVRALIAQGFQPVFITGRNDRCADATDGWLKTHVLYGLDVDTELHMRPSWEERPDAVMKSAMFDAFVAPLYDVLAVFEDRDSVVKMWRDRGVSVFQVNYGDF